MPYVCFFLSVFRLLKRPGSTSSTSSAVFPTLLHEPCRPVQFSLFLFCSCFFVFDFCPRPTRRWEIVVKAHPIKTLNHKFLCLFFCCYSPFVEVLEVSDSDDVPLAPSHQSINPGTESLTVPAPRRSFCLPPFLGR